MHQLNPLPTPQYWKIFAFMWAKTVLSLEKMFFHSFRSVILLRWHSYHLCFSFRECHHTEMTLLYLCSSIPSGVAGQDSVIPQMWHFFTRTFINKAFFFPLAIYCGPEKSARLFFSVTLLFSPVAILGPFFLILIILWLCIGVSSSPFLLARVGLCPPPPSPSTDSDRPPSL